MPPPAEDDLTKPLGVATQAPVKRLSVKAMGMIGACVVGAGAAAYVWINDDGLGGRPQVVVAIEAAKKPAVTSAAADPQPTGTIPVTTGEPPGRSTGSDIESASGVRVVRQGGGETPGALIITVPETPAIGLAPAPDKGLIEKGPHGPLPRIGSDGRKPMDVYARPVATSSKLPASAPRIALMIGGMGLSQNATRHALEKLPRPVTLAFAPYGQGLAGQVASARDQGHEVMLQAPLEPFDLAGEGPGPRMLRTSQDKAELKDNLHWHMSRFPGYVGIANFLGAKFLANANATAALIEETNSRGLFILDDGSAPQSLAAKIATSVSAPHVVADLVIDTERDGQAVEKALLRLESIAREKGTAVGVATGLPETVDRIARFTAGLEKRGIALVPVSALIAKTARPTARIRLSPQK